MIITISGTPGSGKSTIAKILARKLGYKHYSTGDFMREIAKKRKLTLEEIGEVAKTDMSIDKELDERQQRLGKTEDNFVIDGRLSFHFIPHSVKLFIDADITARAERIFKDVKKGLRKEEQVATIPDMMEKLEKRRSVEMERYKQHYDMRHPYDSKNYDLMIDTTKMTAEQGAQKIIEFIQKNGKTYK